MNAFINLFVNGVATGMLIFLLAAGLTLIFGLMDVLNFAHGGLFAWGAYVGAFTFATSGSLIVAAVCALAAGVVLGFILERFIIKPVYGNHVQQILITLGVLIVLGELLKVFWGPNPLVSGLPPFIQGSWNLNGVVLIKYRLLIIIVGFIVLAGLHLLMKRTKLGLIVRAGVSNKEMVQALGINVRMIFAIVFMLGSGLAALGGALFGPYSGTIYAEMGLEFGILAFIVVVIGGMGNLFGSAFASLLVGLSGAFMAWYLPDLSLAVNMLLMVIVLLFKPSGLFGVKG